MKKILVIEDNQEVKENLAEILELSNYEVITAENGVIGVEKAQKESPDLILCDVMMPELDGFGVLHILSKRETTANIPFIFLTAKTDKSDLRKGMNLGADDYITKPFDDTELLDAIETRFRKHEQLKKQVAPPRTAFFGFTDSARGYEELKKLTSNRKIKVYQKKEIIFEEGEFPRQLFYVKSGKVKVFKTNDEGKEFIIEIVTKDKFLGYLDLIKGKEYVESAASMEHNTQLIVIPKDDFIQLLYSNNDVSNNLIKMLAENVAEKEETLLHLAYNSIRKRVADSLLLLHHQNAPNKIVARRDDLAGMVGTAKESVIRTLTDFKKEKLIEIKNGEIKILNEKKLKNLPN